MSKNRNIRNDGIAHWKIDSKFERYLSKKADHSPFWKKVYVKYYAVFDHEYYEKGLPMIERNINLFKHSLSAKEKREYVTDMVYSLHRFGCMFDEYFLLEFDKLNSFGRMQFITDKIRHDFYNVLNKIENMEVFNDKGKTYSIFKEYYKRDVVVCAGGGMIPFRNLLRNILGS